MVQQLNHEHKIFLRPDTTTGYNYICSGHASARQLWPPTNFYQPLPLFHTIFLLLCTCQLSRRCESCLRSKREIWPTELLNGNTEHGISQTVFTKEAWLLTVGRDYLLLKLRYTVIYITCYGTDWGAPVSRPLILTKHSDSNNSRFGSACKESTQVRSSKYKVNLV